MRRSERLFGSAAILLLLLACSAGHVEARPPLKLELKQVIFDMGGVMVDREPATFQRRMAPISGLDHPRLLALVERFETGKLTIRGFRRGLRSLSPAATKMSDAALDTAWGSQIGSLYCRKLGLVRGLRARGSRPMC